VAERPNPSAERALSFGPFRLLPDQRLLLEDDSPVRLGSRALDILTALVESAGEMVSKNDLIARVWPDTFVDESSLRVHIAGLRRALGDGQPGRRYLANVPGRGYHFVAPITRSEPELLPAESKVIPARAHNLPVSQARVVGRVDVIAALQDQLPRWRFVSVVGEGGIGKTTVALALAEALLPAYEDGVWLVDLAPVDDPLLVPNAVGKALGLTVHSEDAVSRLLDFVRVKRMLVVLDNCEHVVEAAAFLAEQLLGGAPGVHVLATSREPLRAEGERVHRLPPLDSPANPSSITAADALAFPAVRLFVERAAAILDGFELSDADAPIVADICRKLGGIALAIELAAARVDAFGVGQLSVLLDDRFHILRRGRRTAQPRHQSLTAALDWSYAFLPEGERVILRRLSIFAGAFTLESAIAVAGDDGMEVLDAVANLVAKSLVSADVSEPTVQYRLLETTRAYAMQKLIEAGESETYARRHAQHHFDWFKRAEAAWTTRPTGAQWLKDNDRGIDDVRSALNWAFSPDGDATVGVALTVASVPLWLELSLVHECRACVERALAAQALQPSPNERDTLKLRLAHGLVLPHASRFLPRDEPSFAETLVLAERLGDCEAQLRALYNWTVYCVYVGKYREALVLAERHCALAGSSGLAEQGLVGETMVGNTLHYLGDYAGTLRYLDPIVNQPAPRQRALFMDRLMAMLVYIDILWLKGFPEQAVRYMQQALVEARTTGNALAHAAILAQGPCAIPLRVGDLAEAERSVAMLLDYSAKPALNTWNALGRCFQGRLLLARGDFAGLAILGSAVNWLREAGFAFRYAISLGALAEGLAAAGQPAEAREAIGEALERAESNEEHWCMPELLRIKGEIMRSDGSATTDAAAEDCFRRALDWARRQGALSWELRAATSLARSWHQNGRTAEADAMLRAVYDRFTEGFDTIDLRTAAALLNELRAGPG
jgi:predicted ATPase/DNA-binding winged helix-turn-helix (wHTH) protein